MPVLYTEGVEFHSPDVMMIVRGAAAPHWVRGVMKRRFPNGEPQGEDVSRSEISYQAIRVMYQCVGKANENIRVPARGLLVAPLQGAGWVGRVPSTQGAPLTRRPWALECHCVAMERRAFFEQVEWRRNAEVIVESSPRH